MKSQNGYPANGLAKTKVWRIPGTKRDIRLQSGDAGYLLVHFAAWFDQNIEPIDAGQLDDWGYAPRNVRGSSEVSNHASGTAIDLNATRHPLGKSGTFSRTQTAAIRAQLAKYDGCIRWGGDYSGRKDEMHFEINRPANVVAGVAQRLKTPEDPVAAITADLLAVAKKHGVTYVYLARVALKAAAAKGTGSAARKRAVAASRVLLRPFK